MRRKWNGKLAGTVNVRHVMLMSNMKIWRIVRHPKTNGMNTGCCIAREFYSFNDPFSRNMSRSCEKYPGTKHWKWIRYMKMLHAFRYSWWWLLGFCASVILSLLRFTRELSLHFAFDYCFNSNYISQFWHWNFPSALFGTFVGLVWLAFELFSFGSRQLCAAAHLLGYGYTTPQRGRNGKTGRKRETIRWVGPKIRDVCIANDFISI